MTADLKRMMIARALAEAAADVGHEGDDGLIVSGGVYRLADAVLAVLDEYARLPVIHGGPACSECGGRPKRGLIKSEDDRTWQCDGCYTDLAGRLPDHTSADGAS